MPDTASTLSARRSRTFDLSPQVLALAAILGLRMFGLFMVLPVLALYAAQMPGASSMGVGLAIGIYGLTQAALQIPFGRMSDRVGRRPVIAFGLLVFAAGSVLAAVAGSLAVLIAGRALQGAGAISAAVTAFVSDLTPPVRRTRAMALVGIVIGMAFILAFVAGPVLAAWFGVPALFWLSGILALAGLVLLVFTGSGQAQIPQSSPASDLTRVFARVWPQAAGILLLHAILTALFVALPGVLSGRMGLPPAEHGWLYLPVMFGSLLLLVPLVLVSERGRARGLPMLAILLLAAGQLGLMQDVGIAGAGLALVLFFGGFNFLEANLPAEASVRAGAESRGAGLGVYATAQFMGAFLGGIGGGWVIGQWGGDGVFVLNLLLCALWMVTKLCGHFFASKEAHGE